MPRFYLPVLLLLWFAHTAFAREQSVLARVTVYWHGASSKERIAATGPRLRDGHCAVDPKKIPYGSKVLLAGDELTAVDTGPAVISRKAARLCGRTAAQRNAVVVDRYFETRKEALAWEATNPHFMSVRVITPASEEASAVGQER
jgi:hypothetical protein